MNFEWNLIENPANIQDERFIVGKEYLVLTFTGDYTISKYTGKSFFGLPLLVKAWSEFKRYENI